MNIMFVHQNINAFDFDDYHVGLAYIVSMTVREGHDVRVLSVTNKSGYALLIDEVKSFKPVVIGFSSVSSQFVFVKQMSAMVKKLFPEILIVCGGIHPTLFPSALLETKDIDGFFIGESEFSFVEFLGKIENGDCYKDTENFAYTENNNVIQNKLKPINMDLDSLPSPNKKLFPFQKIIDRCCYAPFHFTRGCPYKCTYCCNETLASIYGGAGNKIRARSPEASINEIEAVIKEYNNIDFISIQDDVLGKDDNWRREFCEKYKKCITKKFMCNLRVDMVNEDLVLMLKDAGCFRVLFGVESGNEYIRKEVMNRKMITEKIIKSFDLCNKHGLATVAVNIIGVPGETEEMIWDTIRLNRRLRPTESGVNIFYPYHGTKLGDQCFAQGLVDEEKYKSFSSERRETVLKFSEEHSKVLRDFYENWQILIYPYNLDFRIRKFLEKIGITRQEYAEFRYRLRNFLIKIRILKFVRKIKKYLSLLFFRLFGWL